MTRDEAIKLLWIDKNLCHSGGSGEAKNLVDKLSALGVLKLDEPKSARDKFEEKAVEMHDWLPADDTASILYEVRQILDAAGLKIVEK